MRTRFKKWVVPYLEEHTEYSLTDEELSKLDNFQLEIGSGKGEFLITMAEKFPKEKFLGIEKNITCAGITVKKLVEKEMKNVNFLYRDAQEVIGLFKDKSIKNIFLNFSDPWPKRRHQKRRLTSEIFLNEYRRILKDDGKLIFKTDNPDLFEYSIMMFEEHNFNIVKIDNNYDGLDEFDTQTEYEEFYRKENTPIHRLIVSK